MQTTFINDRMQSEYPFYELGNVPFCPGLIKYLGVCLMGSESSPIFASAISVAADGVLVSLCREVDGSDTGEMLGSIYTDSASGASSAIFASRDVSGSISLMIDKNALKDSYGSYSGKFYLDPSCVTYMSSDVFGKLHTVVINGSTQAVGQALNFTYMGKVIRLDGPQLSEDRTECTITLSGSAAVDSFKLVESGTVNEVYVTSVNLLQTPDATTDDPTPVLEIAVDDGSTNSIALNPVKGSTTEPADLVVEIIGNTNFPSCFDPVKDEA